MSTHNALIQAGGDTYFELIAIDPHAPPPGRKRWFSLDNPATQAYFESRPRALCWVVSVRDLDALVAKSPIYLGEILSSARGDLSWRLTVPKDGHLPLDGLMPAFIEWPDGQNPCHRMPDKGVRLNQITISSPEPDQISDLMMSLGVSHLAHIVEGATGLRFDMTTPAWRDHTGLKGLAHYLSCHLAGRFSIKAFIPSSASLAIIFSTMTCDA